MGNREKDLLHGGRLMASFNRKTSFGEGEPIFLAIRGVLLLALGLAFAAPFFWTISTSLKELSETTTLPPEWIPRSNVYSAVVDGKSLTNLEVVWSTPENVASVDYSLPAGTALAWIRPRGSQTQFRPVDRSTVTSLKPKAVSARPNRWVINSPTFTLPARINSMAVAVSSGGPA